MAKEIISTLAQALRKPASRLSEQDLHLFNEGTHYRIYDKLGAHLSPAGEEQGTSFGV
jgi:1,4-alpha-glucan branching enzyme